MHLKSTATHQNKKKKYSILHLIFNATIEFVVVWRNAVRFHKYMEQWADWDTMKKKCIESYIWCLSRTSNFTLSDLLN